MTTSRAALALLALAAGAASPAFAQGRPDPATLFVAGIIRLVRRRRAATVAG